MDRTDWSTRFFSTPGFPRKTIHAVYGGCQSCIPLLIQSTHRYGEHPNNLAGICGAGLNLSKKVCYMSFTKGFMFGGMLDGCARSFNA